MRRRAINRLWDVSGSPGGTIAKDKVCSFSTLRHRGNYTDVVGMYDNLNADDISKWTYVPADGKDGRPLQPAISEVAHAPITPLACA